MLELLKRCKRLYVQSKNYDTMDHGWRRNFLARGRRLAQSIQSEVDAADDVTGDLSFCVQYLDVIELQCGIMLWPKV